VLIAVAAAVVAAVVGYIFFLTPGPAPSGPGEGQPGGAEEESGFPVYPGSSTFSLPDDMREGFGIPPELPCDAYTVDADPENVMDWYQVQLEASEWTLVGDNEFSPPDQPGVTIFIRWYRKGDNGVFMFAMSDPQMGGTVFGVIVGAWASVQSCGTFEGEQEGEEPEGEGQGEPQLPDMGEGPVLFTVCPVDLSYVTMVEPLGNLNPPAGHTFPSDHGGLGVNGVREVRAPADGIITGVQVRSSNDYKLVIHHTNTFKCYLDHLSSIEDFILAEVDPSQEFSWVQIPVTAGQVVGSCGGVISGMDWGVVDYDVTLNFINPDRYGDMAHSVHFLPYCEENLKNALLGKLPRTAEPRWGKIDFDQPGALVGNWFHETIGEQDPLGEWEKHLSFVYYMWDPSQIRVAVGGILNLPSGSGLYGVEGNSPDPADITTEDGAVVYRLRGTEEYGETSITATLLVEMVDENRIKVEGFPGHVSNPQFTSNAQYYIR